jgi:signal transduction histidine kinase
MPRLTLRTQLMLLYAVPFLLSSAALLSILILGTSETVPAGTDAPPPSTPDDIHLAPVVTASAIGLAVMVVISLLLGWLIAGRFLRPLRTITATARDISASNLHRRLGRTGRYDEFTELAATLDDLFERLEASFESQRRFVANASHELRTPLTAERTLLQVALADPDTDPESLRTACLEVLKLGQAQERLINSLLTLASGEQGIEHREPFDLAGIARNMLEARPAPDLHVVASLAPAPATGDPDLAESLMANLVDNALRHNLPGGHVEVTTATVQGRATLTVSNTGEVIPLGELDRLFEPFQRLGRQRIQRSGGHGLGLAIVRAIARAHGATLIPQARPEGGLRIEVVFPAAATGGVHGADKRVSGKR